MSAATERLVEQISLVEQAIKTADAIGQDSTPLKEDLRLLQQKLATSNKALNEGKQILKD